MFDSIHACLVQGERLAQAISPARLEYGGNSFPCKVGALEFHEMLGDGGVRQIKAMRVTILRADIAGADPETLFKTRQTVWVIRKVAGGTTGSEESVEMQIGDVNASDAFAFYLMLERTPV